MVLEENASEEILNWLLEPSNPSVRYWTLRDLFHLAFDDDRIIETQKMITETKCVLQILLNQIDDSYWSNPDDMYNPKYKATTHNLLILAELGTTRISQIENAIEHIFQYQRNSGHFLINLPKSERGKASKVYDGCCIDGNIISYLTLFGYTEDPRFKELLEFQITHYDAKDGGWPCRAYSGDTTRVIPINCYMGRMKVLKGLSYLPDAYLSSELREIIELEIEQILENEIFYYLKKPDGSRKEKAGWKRFGFPLFYTTDILEVLDILTRLGVKDDRMSSSIDIVLSQQQKNGKWLLKNSFNDKMYCQIEEKGKPSKWITLRALRVLQNWM